MTIPLGAKAACAGAMLLCAYVAASQQEISLLSYTRMNESFAASEAIFVDGGHRCLEEADMDGYQLTFYTEQNRRHGHHTVTEWLLHEARQLGIHGATVINCAEGTGHAGTHHAAHMLRLLDQPVQIILAVTQDEAERMLSAVKSAHVHVFYTRSPVEFGLIGDDGHGDARKHFSLFHPRTH